MSNSALKDKTEQAAAIPASRSIVLNIRLFDIAVVTTLLGLCVLVLVILFRQASFKSPSFVVVNSELVVERARNHVAKDAVYEEFIDVEVVEFLKNIQSEMDRLSAQDDISIILSSESILSGKAEDYSEYIFLYAKEAYEEGLQTRQSLTRPVLVQGTSHLDNMK